MGEKVVTEAQAWAILAEYYGNNPKKQYICFLLEDISWCEYKKVRINGVREWPVKDMLSRINSHLDEVDDQFVHGGLTLNDADGRPFPRNDTRVIFCTLMVLECKAEKSL